jgi:hypothetical protein
MDKNYQLETQAETIKRKREIDALVRIVEPDPKYHPSFISDRATLFDIFLDTEQEMRDKLEAHFRKKLEVSLHLVLWKLVDELKRSDCFF